MESDSLSSVVELSPENQPQSSMDCEDYLLIPNALALSCIIPLPEDITDIIETELPDYLHPYQNERKLDWETAALFEFNKTLKALTRDMVKSVLLITEERLRRTTTGRKKPVRNVRTYALSLEHFQN